MTQGAAVEYLAGGVLAGFALVVLAHVTPLRHRLDRYGIALILGWTSLALALATVVLAQ